MEEDPYQCPKCGSKNVSVQNFTQIVRSVNSIGESTRFKGYNPSYDAVCHDCGLKVHVEDYPPGMGPE